MKKTLILAAVAAIALSACSKNDIIETINKVPEEVAIGFSNYTPTSLTKAGDTYVNTTTLVNGKHFGVYAWQTAYNTFLDVNPGTPNFMNPVDVTWNGDTTDGDGNTYEAVRYWPSGDEPQNLSFTAYYPYGGAGIGTPSFPTSPDPNKGGVGTYTFTAQSTPATMVDFCVADVVNDQVYGNTNAGSSYKNTVKFTFKHQLTKVQFKFKTIEGLASTTVIELVDADLTGIQNAGTLTATFAQAAAPQAVNKLGTTTTEWSNVSGAASYEITVYDGVIDNSNAFNPNNVKDPEDTDDKRVKLTSTPTTVDTTSIFLMVPQDMAADVQKLVVKWRVKVYDTAAHATANDGTGLLSETLNTKTLSLYSDLKASDSSETAAAAINWAKNNFITYTITIGPKPIWFTATVDDWGSEQNGYMNVN